MSGITRFRRSPGLLYQPEMQTQGINRPFLINQSVTSIDFLVFPDTCVQNNIGALSVAQYRTNFCTAHWVLCFIQVHCHIVINLTFYQIHDDVFSGRATPFLILNHVSPHIFNRIHIRSFWRPRKNLNIRMLPEPLSYNNCFMNQGIVLNEFHSSVRESVRGYYLIYPNTFLCLTG